MAIGHCLEFARLEQRYRGAIGQLVALPAQERSDSSIAGIACLVGKLFNRHCGQMAYQRINASILADLFNRRFGVVDLAHAGQAI